MTLGLNILFLEPSKVGGSETFVLALLKYLDQDFARRHRVVVYCTRTFASVNHYDHLILKPLIPTASNRFIRLGVELFYLPLLTFKDRLNLLHSIGYTSPLVAACPQVLTLFDLQFRAVPSTVSLPTRIIYRLLVPLVLLSNRRIMAISRFTKNQVKKYYPFITTKKISVVYLGHSVKKKPLPLKNRQDYIYTPSATHPHKNLHRLVEAFALYHQTHPKSATKLYISGFAGLQQTKIDNLVSDLKLAPWVVFKGWLPYDQVISFMASARLCVFPSLYEGFGLPAIEALAVGTPLAVSSIPVFKEIIGSHALYFDPLDVESIKSAVATGLSDQPLLKKLSQTGLGHASKFTWDQHFSQITAVYLKYK